MNETVQSIGEQMAEAQGIAINPDSLIWDEDTTFDIDGNPVTVKVEDTYIQTKEDLLEDAELVA